MTTSNDKDQFVETTAGNVAVRLVGVASAGYNQSNKSINDLEQEKFTTNGDGDVAVSIISTSP